MLLNELLTILCLAMMAFGAASVTWLYDFSIGSPGNEGTSPHRIFSFIGFWLEAKDAVSFNENPKAANWLKPLGLCPICTSVWVAWLTYPFACHFLSLDLLHIIIFAVIYPSLSAMFFRAIW